MVVPTLAGKGRGYQYFGAAKKLPGVKELFEAEPVKVVRRTRAQMHKAIDPDYYGFRDEEDGVLETAESRAEKLIRMQVRCVASASSSRGLLGGLRRGQDPASDDVTRLAARAPPRRRCWTGRRRRWSARRRRRRARGEARPRRRASPPTCRCQTSRCGRGPLSTLPMRCH